jgi:hypothetical protein
MTEPTLPWYRHRWPWLIMSGPAIVVVAGIATMVIAIRTADPMVANYDARFHTGGKVRVEAPAARAPARIEPVEPVR